MIRSDVYKVALIVTFGSQDVIVWYTGGMIRMHKCPSCGLFFGIVGKPAEYYEDLFDYNRKLAWLCNNCAAKMEPFRNYGTLGTLVAVSGADYIEDFGEIDF